ncbi:MAG: peptidoglycan -binding protein [Alphaproteobacteria bacterium]
MALSGARGRSRYSDGAGSWPGFVDALSTLLLVIIFLLVVFVISQVVLSFAISGKDEALERLNRQVAELSDLLDLERQANAELRLNVAQLSGSLQSAVATRDDLAAQIEELSTRADEMERRALAAEGALEDASDTRIVDKETLELRLREIVSLRRDLAALKQLRDDLERQVTEMAAALQAAQDQAVDAAAARDEYKTNLDDAMAQLTALRDRSRELQAELSTQQERTALKQQELETREVKLAELTALLAQIEVKYDESEQLSATRKAQVAALTQQINALRDELKKLSALLEVAERENQGNQAQIADLGARLNRALANKVEELSRYRSEFFGRLRGLLADNRNVQVVGDRFVFQSEVLFGSGSAELGPAGKEQLRRLAALLLDIAREIPSDLNWVLRIDGHTDIRPIFNERFPSNWELSAARAISVAKYLADQGVPANRLAPTGFAEFQPLDDRSDEIAFRRNRRIEMKLTTR